MRIPVGFAQVNFIFSGTAAPRGAQVVIGVDNTDTPATALGVATAAKNAWVDNILTLQTSSITLSSVRAKLGPNDTGPDAVLSVGTAGGNAVSTVTPQVALLVNKVTALGGRKNKGRMFLPGFSEAAFDSAGILNPDTKTALDALLADFLADLETSLLPAVLLHDDEVTAPTPIVSLLSQSKAATQRRRLRKVGGRRAIID